MTNMQERIYNGGTIVGRKVSLDVGRDDPVEYLVNAIREAAEGLERVSFDIDSEDGGYLEVVGTPTGELLAQCVAEHQRKKEQERQARIEHAERVLRMEGRL